MLGDDLDFHRATNPVVHYMEPVSVYHPHRYRQDTMRSRVHVRFPIVVVCLFQEQPA